MGDNLEDTLIIISKNHQPSPPAQSGMPCNTFKKPNQEFVPYLSSSKDELGNTRSKNETNYPD